MLVAWASSKGSGEPAHLRSLARVFASLIHGILMKMKPVDKFACLFYLKCDRMHVSREPYNISGTVLLISL